MLESRQRAATDRKIFMENCRKILIYYLTTEFLYDNMYSNKQQQHERQKGRFIMKRTKTMVYTPSEEANELFLYAINNGKLYRRMTENVLDNLEKKIKKGIYDKEKAIDLWYYVATEASNKYFREFGYKFSVADRFTCAVELEDYYKEDIENN